MRLSDESLSEVVLVGFTLQFCCISDLVFEVVKAMKAFFSCEPPGAEILKVYLSCVALVDGFEHFIEVRLALFTSECYHDHLHMLRAERPHGLIIFFEEFTHLGFLVSDKIT